MKKSSSNAFNGNKKMWVIIGLVVLVPVIAYVIYQLYSSKNLSNEDAHAGTLGDLTATNMSLDIPVSAIDEYFDDMASMKYKYVIVGSSGIVTKGHSWNAESLCPTDNKYIGIAETATAPVIDPFKYTSYVKSDKVAKIFANAKKYNIQLFFGTASYDGRCLNINSGLSKNPAKGTKDADRLATYDIKLAKDLVAYAKENGYIKYFGGFVMRETGSVTLLANNNTTRAKYLTYLAAQLKSIDAYPTGQVTIVGGNPEIKSPYKVVASTSASNDVSYDNAYKGLSTLMSNPNVEVVSLNTLMANEYKLDGVVADTNQFKALSDAAKKYNKVAWGVIQLYDHIVPPNVHIAADLQTADGDDPVIGSPSGGTVAHTHNDPISFDVFKARLAIVKPYVTEIVAGSQQVGLTDDKTFYNLGAYTPDLAVKRAILRAGYENHYRFNLLLTSITKDTTKKTYVTNWTVENYPKTTFTGLTLHVVYMNKTGDGVKSLDQDVTDVKIDAAKKTFSVSLPWSLFANDSSLKDEIAIYATPIADKCDSKATVNGNDKKTLNINCGDKVKLSITYKPGLHESPFPPVYDATVFRLVDVNDSGIAAGTSVKGKDVAPIEATREYVFRSIKTGSNKVITVGSFAGAPGPDLGAKKIQQSVSITVK